MRPSRNPVRSVASSLSTFTRGALSTAKSPRGWANLYSIQCCCWSNKFACNICRSCEWRNSNACTNKLQRNGTYSTDLLLQQKTMTKNKFLWLFMLLVEWSNLNTSQPFKAPLARHRSREKILLVKRNLKFEFCHLKKKLEYYYNFF